MVRKLKYKNIYECEICKKWYITIKFAVECENSHIKPKTNIAIAEGFKDSNGNGHITKVETLCD